MENEILKETTAVAQLEDGVDFLGPIFAAGCVGRACTV